MGQYCDTKELERNWFNWMVAEATPAIERYRKEGKLWTKFAQIRTHSKSYDDPTHKERTHYVVREFAVTFKTDHGVPRDLNNGRIDIHEYVADKANAVEVTTDWLAENGYLQEPPKAESWDALLRDVHNICNGISMKFRQKTEEDQKDLANEAFGQVVTKLISKKLIYTPGRAPVFNLLTTTIHRCMFSIMNRKNKQKANLKKMIDQMARTT